MTFLAALKAGINEITFASKTVAGDLMLAGLLFLPEGFDPNQTYPAVIFSPPFNQVKEQTGAVYGRHLAEKGYVTLVFDHAGYGDSEGVIRNNENSFVKMDSIRDAISFTGTLPFVDKDKLYGLGVCASGSYMALVATTDKRLKAIATVSGMMGNQASYFATMDREMVTGLIAMQNAGRQKAYETGKIDYVDALGFEAEIPAIKEGAAPSEGYDYYMTERAGAETYPNYNHLAPSFMLEAPMLADAQSYAPYLYTPYIGIVGSKAMDPASGILATGPLTKNYYDHASEPKLFVEINGASHVDLYDKDEYVTLAVDKMDEFFRQY
ncbi:alpha/beta hydrolase [Neptuniibacter sp.]|uniref:alpha/beta hydrolase n=1 Tax=Neptuniibacter sp. TaxID=1962643 RepID=UPI00262A3B13|nr:alpha/beta hydrolase [Neptuniibacter sp.]MCP4596263.1 alpha/beta hydrolase [Neptuniibacter sp.]